MKNFAALAQLANIRCFGVRSIFGWRVLKILHNPATYRKYEKVLSIEFKNLPWNHRLRPEKSIGYAITEKLGSFLGGQSMGKRKVADKGLIDNQAEVEKHVAKHIAGNDGRKEMIHSEYILVTVKKFARTHGIDWRSHPAIYKKRTMAVQNSLEQSTKRSNLHHRKGSIRMDARASGITIRGNSAQIAFTYQGDALPWNDPIPTTKAAQKELVLKRQAILGAGIRGNESPFNLANTL